MVLRVRFLTLRISIVRFLLLVGVGLILPLLLLLILSRSCRSNYENIGFGLGSQEARSVCPILSVKKIDILEVSLEYFGKGLPRAAGQPLSQIAYLCNSRRY
jgi:hypothetical protein